jgi:chitin disaccharide deacetylase
MHLCANVVLGRLLPAGCVVRRNYSFQPGEKSLANCLYRKTVDRLLARRHDLADFLFSLQPLESKDRLQRIIALARRFAVEVETHPVEPQEYHFLAGGEIFKVIGDLPIAPSFVVTSNGSL